MTHNLVVSVVLRKMIFEEKKMCVYVWAFKFDKTVRFECKWKTCFIFCIFIYKDYYSCLEYGFGDLKKKKKLLIGKI